MYKYKYKNIEEIMSIWKGAIYGDFVLQLSIYIYFKLYICICFYVNRKGWTKTCEWTKQSQKSRNSAKNRKIWSALLILYNRQREEGPAPAGSLSTISYKDRQQEASKRAYSPNVLKKKTTQTTQSPIF